MYLSDREIRRLIEEINLVEDYTDLDVQLQQCGFDMTLGEVWTTPLSDNLYGGAHIDFDNSRRQLANMRRIHPTYISPVAKSGGWWHLEPGAYVFITRETVNLPSWLAYFMLPRSSLTRNGHVFSTALGDPGYSGRNRLSVHIANPGINIMHGARFGQMVFVKLSQPVAKPYAGVYTENKP